ncbi:PHD-finger [Microdochium nivale]|nr:PHD-finger [Microdochium nivale]
MSGEGSSSSSGVPRSQPPTPRQTPTSAAFPTSVPETPNSDRHAFENTNTWTPKFAEEYSVFNSTPGNLIGGHGRFPDFSAPSPHLGAASGRRPLSVESLAVGVVTHTTYLSHNQQAQLPPVDPSRRLLSSPAGLITDTRAGVGEPEKSTIVQNCLEKRKRRKDSLGLADIQTATPPSSGHKGGQRLVPKPQDEVMQDEHLYTHDFVAGPIPQQNMGSFTMASPTDMFGFPLAPVTAPAYTEARSFWDTDMTGMEMDFSMADASMFQAAAAAGHRAEDSMDWGRANEMFQAQGMTAPPNHHSRPPSQPISRKERILAPKPVAHDAGPPSRDGGALSLSFPVGVDDPFAMGGAAGVDPGLLFTRPTSSGMISATFDPMGQMPLLGQPMLQSDHLSPTFAAPVQGQGDLCRSASSNEVSMKKGERVVGTLPAKALGRPGISRSMSENRGRKTLGRSATLPTLAPASRSMAPPPQQSQQNITRPSAANSRSSGRVSPLKHNRRLSSLASIPESVIPRTRTAVKFTIDSRGRARAETTTVVVGKGKANDDDRAPRAARALDPSRKNRSPSKSWASGEDDSSSDDEPIIIPSRSSSFMMPEHPRPKSTDMYHLSQRSTSENSNSTLGIYFNEQQQDGGGDSDAETVLNASEIGRPVGDAASELRKVVQTRHKHMSVDTSRPFIPIPSHGGGAVSPTKLGDASLPTPSSDRGSHVRCVCSSTQSRINGDAYMVQCESCEMYLHGKCINITRQTHPKVYICAYCANTSNAQGQTSRDPRAGGQGGSMPRVSTSPLAHKNFQSFR